MKYCIICRKHIRTWLPYNNINIASSKTGPKLPPEFRAILGCIGSDINNFWCSQCGSTDRERHLLLYFFAINFFDNINDKKILHIAPEKNLGYILKEMNPAEYLCGDLHPTNKEHIKIDCQDLHFNDEYFDVIICNHVLEHVHDLHKSLNELARCLKPGGRLIAQTPYSNRLKYTLEFIEIPSRDACIEFFYQDDHVRLLGMDIVELFNEHGLHGSLTPHKELLPNIDALKAGVNAEEPFFNFIKRM